MSIEAIQLFTQQDWSGAACRGVDAELFYPGRGMSTREAKAACAVCPIKIECLDFAVTNGERFGVWGGMSERERRRIRAANCKVTSR